MYNGLWEKDLTLQIAAAMYRELCQYEGITVVLTRTEDVDLSLEQRAQIAADARRGFSVQHSSERVSLPQSVRI